MMASIGRNGHRGPGVAISGSGYRQSRRERAAQREKRRALLVVGLGAASRLLREPGFQAKVITGAIGAAALVSLAKESQARSIARMAIWDKQQSLREQRKLAAHD